MRIVFFGTPEFAVESLDSLIEAGEDIAAVVTMPDKIAGRGHRLIESDVKKYARGRGLRILQPEKLRNEEFLSELRALDADLFVVIAFRMLPEVVWSMPPKGTFNLHAALLPKYRGAAPINHAIMNGETETGVTTFFLNSEIDTGDIIDQRRIAIRPEEDCGDVYDNLMRLGAEMVVETVRKIENGTLESRPQPEGEFTPAPKIFKETCRLDFTLPAIRLHNQVRGLSPYPGAWCVMTDSTGKETEAKIFKTAVGDGNTLAPGELRTDGRRMWVGTGDLDLEIKELQTAGKKRMETSAFLLGNKPARLG